MSNKNTELFDISMGQRGGEVIADTNAHTGIFCAIFALEDCVINTTTGNITGISALTLSAGFTILGRFTSVTLTSGTALLYNGV